MHESFTWQTAVSYAAQEVDRLRKKNDADLGPIETAAIRGEIRALNRLIALPMKAAQEALMAAQHAGQLED